MNSLDFTEIEREVCRLPEVSAARFVSDESGRPTEVHILARPGKHPKQVVRDVQSVALASFGLQLDRRVVSVVQLADEEIAANGQRTHTAPRPAITAIHDETSRTTALIRVTLTLDDREGVGLAEGSIASIAHHRLVASATLSALRQLVPGVAEMDIDTAQVVKIGRSHVALVTIVLVEPPSEKMLSGSAIIRDHHDAEAIVRAVLDATNRRLSTLT